MGDVVAGGKPSTKSNAERVATCLNSLLGQLSSGPDFELAIVGYKSEKGQVDVGSRWGGSLAGREFVSVSELAAAPLRFENRSRKLPPADGTVREETVSLPIWYAASLGEKAPEIAGYNYCRDLLSRWLSSAGPDPGVPLVVHVFSSASGDGNPQMAVAKLMEVATPLGPTLLLQAHLATSAALVTTLYPSSLAYVTLGAPRDLFRRVSPLPAHLVDALREARVTINANARGMLHNGKIADLIRFFGLIKAHAKTWPYKQTAATVAGSADPVAGPAAGSADFCTRSEGAAADEASLPKSPTGQAGGEKAGLALFVLDRSVADPFGGNMENPCIKLQEQANDLLKQISKLKDGQLDVAILSYGLDGTNQTEVRTTFDGPLAGKTVVPHTDLATGALRVEEHEEQVSNGIGGLVTVTRKNPVYYDIEPAGSALPIEAFAAAGQIAVEWCAHHPAACLPPVLLHLTRGQPDDTAMEQAAAKFQSDSSSAGVVYHLIMTESPHKSLAYPDTDGDIESSSLKRLWNLSSPLLGRERLCNARPTIKSSSRGFVINGKFDLFVEGIKDALATT